MIKAIQTLVILSLFSTILLSGCTSDIAPEKVIRPVRAAQLVDAQTSVVREFSGIVQAARETKLAFRVAGPVLQIVVKEGEYATAGQLVALLDPRDYQVRIDASRARHDELSAQLERIRSMYENGHVARADLDRVQAGYDMASADLQAATNALHDTRLLAPYDGRVGLQLAEEHDVVATGQPILTFLDAGSLEVRMGLPEELMANSASFHDFEVELDLWPARPFPAVLRFLGQRPQAGSQTYALTVAPELPDDVAAVAGMTAQVRFSYNSGGSGDGFVVPLVAVANGADHRSRVWIFDPENGTVGSREVTVGALTSAGVMISGDLKAGDWLVTAGANVLNEGQQVRLLEAPSASNVGGIK